MAKSIIPEMVRLVRQSGFHADCAVASLAMLAGVLYEDALIAFGQREILIDGATWPKVIRAAKKLGIVARVKRHYDLTEDTGILHVNGKEDHLVFLWAGRIVEGNGELWLDPEDYFRHYEVKPFGLLVRA